MSSLSRPFHHGWSCSSVGWEEISRNLSHPALLVQGVTLVPTLLFPNLSWISHFLPRRSVSLGLSFCFSDQFLLSCLPGMWRESSSFLPQLFMTTVTMCSFILHADTVPFLFPYKTDSPLDPCHSSTLCSHWPRSFSSLGCVSDQDRAECLDCPKSASLVHTNLRYFSFPGSCKVCDPLWSLITFPRNSPIVLQHRQGFLVFLLQPEASHFSPFNQFIFRLFIQFVKNILNSNPVL